MGTRILTGFHSLTGGATAVPPDDVLLREKRVDRGVKPSSLFVLRGRDLEDSNLWPLDS